MSERINYNNLENDPRFKNFEDRHTADFNELSVNIFKLHEITKGYPVLKQPLETFTADLDDVCWTSIDETRVSPRAVADLIIAEGFETAKANHPELSKHIEKIQTTDYTYPIYIYQDKVLDGNHRLARLYIESKIKPGSQDFITTKVLKSIPDEAQIKK